MYQAGQGNDWAYPHQSLEQENPSGFKRRRSTLIEACQLAALFLPRHSFD